VLYGYLPKEHFDAETFDIEAFGEHYRAQRAEGPLYDPDNARLKA
jgi:hypothetical protein